MRDNTHPEKSAAAAISVRNAFLLHYSICSLGFFEIILLASSKLFSLLFSSPQPPFNEGAISFFFPGKPEILIFYLLSCCGLLAYYGALYLFLWTRTPLMEEDFFRRVAKNRRSLVLYAAGLLSANLGVLASNKLRASGCLAGVILWFSICLAPLCRAYWTSRGEADAIPAQAKFDRTLALLLIAISAQFLTLFIDPISRNLKMINEFMDIPEQTRMGNGYVDNTAYINQNRMMGLLKYSPERDRGDSPIPDSDHYVRFPESGLLDGFIADHALNYYYDGKLGALVVNRSMTDEERAELIAIAGNNGQKEQIERLFYSSARGNYLLSKKVYSPEELKFFKKNEFELRWQVLARWVIHHHNFVLGPINAYALGKPLTALNVQYGLFNVVLMKFLLEKTGGITYQNYFRIWFAFWPVYYVMYVAAAFLIFKRIEYVLFAVSLAFASVNWLDYQMLFLGPGLNPIRHFFDAAIAGCLYCHFMRGKRIWLPIGILLCAAAVVNNKEFGFFIFAALAATVTISLRRPASIGPIEKFSAALMGLTAAGIVAAWKHLGKDVVSSYFLEGFYSFPLPRAGILGPLLIFSASSLLLLRYFDIADNFKFILMFLMFYTEGTFIYYIWGGTNNHFLNTACIDALFLAALLKFSLDNSPLRKYAHSMRAFSIASSLLLFYIPSLGAYYYARHQYKKVFVDHRTYRWKLDTAEFVSTMDPKYFVDSVGLIGKYAPRENAIYIISKYDDFLPFLSKKYSAMPFFDLPMFLLTPRETNLCVLAIRDAKPKYLFVDTDINRSLIWEIFNEVVPPQIQAGGREESIWRVQRLKELRKVFSAVQNRYRPVERGLLITVYERKAGKNS